jgi:hypothetical protein
VAIGRNARKYLASRSLEELALEYVVMTNATTRPTKIYSSMDVRHELLRRLDNDLEQVNSHLREAEDTFALCGGELKLPF